jgi:pyruvate kinase
MEKKAKIIATLGPAIYSETKLKQLVNLGVDAFRVNFSHNTNGIQNIVSNIRRIEKSTKKKLSLIADLQGVKLRVGKIKNDNQKIKFNQKFTFDNNKSLGDSTRINFPYPKILKKLKKGNKILIDDGKYTFVVISRKGSIVTTICKSQNCEIKNNKSVHIPNIDFTFNKLTQKDKKDIKFASKLGCNWIALSYIQSEKIILEARSLIKNDIGIISKIENKHALKNIVKIIKASDSIMIARGDLAIDIGHSEVPKVQLSLIKKCSQFSKSVIVATQMLESMIENNTATRAEINDIATAIFQGADAVMLSAEAAIGKFPTQAVSTMSKTIISTEKYKREHIQDFKNSIITNKDPVKSILLSVKDIAYNSDVKAIIVFSNSGKSVKLVSAMRPAAKILTISPNINVCRQVSLLWGVQSINSRDANGWKDMMSISKEIIRKLKFVKKNDFVIITAGLPFGKAGMTNMIRLYKVVT